uniref:RCK N-terminal domain-containing protein n=1 Tax=Kalanchoe fedtschenkoi TaxID=63787 RepID=A0A7N0VE83_KALFE
MLVLIREGREVVPKIHPDPTMVGVYDEEELPHHNNNNESPSPTMYPHTESPPLLKKSRTIPDNSPHFRGPLFPAVRRSASSLAPPLLSASTSSDCIPPQPDHSLTFSDRDWLYPSFLGPHTNRVTSRLTSSSSSSPHHNNNNNKAGSSSVPKPPFKHRSSFPPPDEETRNHHMPDKKIKPSEPDKEFNALALRGLIAASSSNPIVLSMPKTNLHQHHKPSFAFYAMAFSCISFLLYVTHLWNRVAELQAQMNSCHRLSGGKAFKGLQATDDNTSFGYGDAASRTIALYAVVFTLITPFILYEYLDYIPRIQNLSKRTLHGNIEEVPLKKRVAYMIDVCFSVYPYAKLLALLSATIFLIAFGGLALYAVSDGTFAEALWLSWTFIADSGSHADRVGTGPRIVSVSISSGGMLIFAMMLGLVSDAISERVDSLRKGKSEVIERDHVLILGWSEKLGSLLKQLAIANKSIGGGVIVVLAEREKEDMETEITKLEFDFMGTSVICRSGSPLILADLKKVSVSKARAIIVLASDENADQSDARALRVVLSLTGVREGLRGHVVVEMSDLDNEPLVKLVGGGLIETVVAHDVIGRLMIQCALQPGLAQIWEDILGFENAEFYVKRWPQLDGMRFIDVLISFPNAIPCGVKVSSDGGKIIMNPDDNYILKESDEVLVIAEDDDTYVPGPLPEVHRIIFSNTKKSSKFPEKILFCGWRRDIDDMIMVLEAFLAPGSELWMFNEVPLQERERKLSDGGLDVRGLMNIKLVHHVGNAVIRRHLENLPLETFDSILILADESLEDSIVHSDSRSLATLLLIRDIQSKRLLPSKDSKSSSMRQSGFSHSSWIREMQQASDKSIIISEILDSRTRNLVSVSRISDYVLSNEIVSMALAMVAEDKQINRVLEELFAEEGNELRIRPAEFYLFDQEELCFYDIMIRGRQRHEIVIGYRFGSEDRAVINPPDKSAMIKWSIGDVFVVICLEE